ncbi:MAG: universal stress protein [Candidatus Manganitrophus sp. SA1]|nr:universal stress protein [Candidatus Manganitrophus morganii]
MKQNKRVKSDVSRILVPTDFSECSSDALDYAMALAKPLNAELILAHVIEPFPYTAVNAIAFINYEERLIPEVRSLLDELSKRPLREKLSVETHLSTGTASREIIRLAEREEADLIVMGTHGRTGIDHLFTGSVAEKVVRLSPCPVLTVHFRSAGSKRKTAVPKRKTATKS